MADFRMYMWHRIECDTYENLLAQGLTPQQIEAALAARHEFFESLRETSLADAIADERLIDAWDLIAEVLAEYMSPDQLQRLLSFKNRGDRCLIGEHTYDGVDYAVVFLCERYGPRPPDTYAVLWVRVVPS